MRFCNRLVAVALLVAGLAAVPPRLPDDDEDLQMSEAF